MKNSNFEYQKVNVNLEKSVKDWYLLEAQSMAMTMSQYMAFILTQHYKNELRAEGARRLSELAGSEKWEKMAKDSIDGMKELQMMFDDVQPELEKPKPKRTKKA